jgi:N-acetylated-alpha-linked acidic dipeptidase
MKHLLLVFAVIGASTALHAQSEPAEDLPSWPKTARAIEREHERKLNREPDPRRIARTHEILASEPHAAGTAGDRRMVERLKKLFEEAGLAVSLQEIWVYLSHFKGAEVQIVSPVEESLPIREQALEEDPYSGRPDLNPGWNAYSASGEVVGEIVYVNKGTRTDFERLKTRGVRLEGKIALARYGGNYRGYKAKFAEEAGAVGLIIYTDPADSGYMRGIMYPEGGYANPSYIQRGSIKTVPYPGDPLTPGVPATERARRLEAETLALPRIPVQPISWSAAERIMKHMKGPAVPRDWQGGLPLAYRITGGPDLRVRLEVEQERKVTRTCNVIGTLKGAVHPEQKVVLGCHHDAWGFGAADPMAGMIVLIEVARSMAAAARDGRPPARTLVFGAWAAEEHGIIGSTEWVEANREDLLANAVAYINLDMAAMGKAFRAGAAPSLRRVIAAAARAVPQPGEPEGRSVLDAWVKRSPSATVPGEPRFGDLGGGSDHVGFYCHLGIPSAGLGGGGSRGVSYHSIYDNLTWYRKVVGQDYGSAAMIARVVNVLAARLANAPLVPLDPVRIASHMRRHLESLSRLGEKSGLTTSFESFANHYGGELEHPPLPTTAGVSIEFGAMAATTVVYENYARSVYARLLRAVREDRLAVGQYDRINASLMAMERAWLHAPGLPGRPWYKNLYAATDEDSGYAAWILPVLRHALKYGDRKELVRATELYTGVLRKLTRLLGDIEKQLEKP